ncbi:TonB-dependent receptor plug domain-containing protein, partial [Sphingobacterium shayense]|uniref:TonB-dependent receptor plug domain-containing protein n=1 Tax=Sphingobacterium shayense TaxID=626343 RepID=UPI00155206B5
MMRRSYIQSAVRRLPIYKALYRPLLLSAVLGIPSLSSGALSPVTLLGEYPVIQQTGVKGVVVDGKGNPLDGVTIKIKGSEVSTSTDEKGSFEIEVSALPATLIASRVGFTSNEIPVYSRESIRITLQDSATGIDEVVVVGFGSQKKENLTGSVASITMSEVVESRPVTSLSAGLAGQAPGLYVNQGSGKPGGDGGTLRVRGQGTLNNANPLVVIDGVVGDMNLINPQDVESISVLKDAASASIYGSRAANGVILITTKRGKTGDFKLS